MTVLIDAVSKGDLVDAIAARAGVSKKMAGAVLSSGGRESGTRASRPCRSPLFALPARSARRDRRVGC